MTDPTALAALPIHELARTFPTMGMVELKELASGIHAQGLLEPITIYQGQILDGRNRISAANMCGYAFKAADFVELDPKIDPLAFVINKNIRRRHLTTEQKRDLLATLIKLGPTKSNRQIGAEAGVSHHTVGDVREELEATGQVAQLETTTGKDGKKRRTKAKGGKPKGPGSGKRSNDKAITYAPVADAKTAINAYSVLEAHLLDALQDLNRFSSFDHADEKAQGTIEKLQEKLSEMQPEAEGEEEAA
jgi:hypothetical protein